MRAILICVPEEETEETNSEKFKGLSGVGQPGCVHSDHPRAHQSPELEASPWLPLTWRWAGSQKQ